MGERAYFAEAADAQFRAERASAVAQYQAERAEERAETRKWRAKVRWGLHVVCLKSRM